MATKKKKAQRTKSNMGNIEASLIHDLIVASVKSQESIKGYMKATSDSLAKLTTISQGSTEKLEELQTTLDIVNEQRKSLHKFIYRVMSPIVITLLLIIGVLLYNMNINGAETIRDVSSKMLSIPR